MPTETALFAKDFLDPQGVVLRSADNVADAVIASLGENDRVSIAMNGMPAVSSSFFNVILRRVLDALGPAALDRLHMATPSAVLRQIFDRSLLAMRQLAG
jgi:hypothetical protein